MHKQQTCRTTLYWKWTNVADVLTKALSLAQYLLFTTFLQEGFKGIEDMTQLNTRNILNYVVHEDFINEVLNC